jgi:hypothetical protein
LHSATCHHLLSSPLICWSPPQLVPLLQLCHVNKSMQYLSFCAWLILLNMMISSFIHFSTNDMIYLLLNNTPLYICITFSLISFWAPRLIPYLGSCKLCFSNMGVYVSLLYVDLHYFGHMPKSRIAGSCDSCIFYFLGKFHSDFHSG